MIKNLLDAGSVRKRRFYSDSSEAKRKSRGCWIEIIKVFIPNPSEALERFGLDAGSVRNPQEVFT